MDRIEIGNKAKDFLGKYKFVLLILGLGILLMTIPSPSEKPAAQETTVSQAAPATRAEELEEILGHIAGVGKVKVLLTEAAGAETLYQTDEDRSSSADSETLRVHTVIVTDSNRGESGLVKSITPPIYLGAIIVCQGGDSPSVRLSIVEAVSNATGISTDRITVLKMK